MKATVERSALCEALGRAKKFAKGAPARPVLSHIRLSVNGTRKLELYATDTEMGLFQALPLDGEHQPGELCLPCAFLEKLVRKAGGRLITIERDGLAGKVGSGTDLFSVCGLDPDDFPACPEGLGGDLVVASGEVSKAIKRVLPFVKPDGPARFSLHRIAVEVRDGILSMVSSDGKRIAWYPIKVPMEKLELKLIPPAFFK
jgi:DNA polymerase-3 subunit beta